MKTAWISFQAVLAAMGGWLGWFMGGCDGFLYALVAFTVIDYLTGLMCAVIDKNVSSEIGLRGIFKKVVIFALVGVGHTIDAYIIGDGGVFRTAVIFFFASNEGVSLLENASRIGLPIPLKLKEILSQLHSEGNKNIKKK
jgi:toxin secretion/phage lysis holin